MDTSQKFKSECLKVPDECILGLHSTLPWGVYEENGMNGNKRIILYHHRMPPLIYKKDRLPWEISYSPPANDN
ncbi:hypothetical protein IscW_ISCW009999 [Ixodes scapularis]|uniref:Uncharacterized protein n=1 Tax=Ixodes scapularis TaxID=6945 RepID=B7Q032_IXOSC|nr:hypothetical protein IscW_ISCW009999 [Ixodes scapularis]|eukprot:XP_002406763.1 hypothetical protein IscW_ISCW009999 [Ixodes scapularis]